jgi:phage gp36-like protein
MSYCTRTDLEARLGYAEVARLADADMDGQEDALTLDQAIADTDALIDGALGPRWPECIGQPSALLVPVAVDLVAERLARGPMRSDDLTDRADRARRTLADIAAGRIPPCSAAAAAVPSAGDVEWEAGRRVFTGGGF